MAGVYTVVLVSNEISNMIPQFESFQWGGIADTVVTGAEDATIARKMLTNKVLANSNSNPTAITIYDDDNVTPLYTRTIGNADGSVVSPTQVLNLGKAT